MTTVPLDRVVPPLRLVLILAFVAGVAYYIFVSIHWPLMCDSPIMHYVNFLMQHGKQPYQAITDNNMPGAYLTEDWAMQVFGSGDLGWRVYDYFLLFLITACMIEIARSVDWLAGFFGGCFFMLLHGAEGPVAANEREQVMTALYLVGYVILFAAVRKRKPALLLAFGIVSGVAASIKPTALLLCCSILILAVYILHRREVPVGRYIGWALGGFAVPLALNIAFLIQHHAVGAFWFVLHTITPAYIALAHPTFPNMLRAALPKSVRWFVILIGVPAACYNLRWNWERWALTMGAAAGLATFFLQQKGFNHHRYTFEALLLFLIGMDLLHGLTLPGWPRIFGAAGILVTVLYFIPSYVATLHSAAGNSDLTLALESDLTHLGGERLQNKVMCFDMVYGCLDALYHLKLVENTGFTGDLLLFFPEQGLASAYYRNMYWQRERSDPADVLVITNEWLDLPNTFDKLQTWPQFVAYLKANYTLVATREFPMEARTAPPPPRGPRDEPYRAYRIYIRNGTPLLATAPAGLGVSRP